jgi:hypothetical protein
VGYFHLETAGDTGILEGKRRKSSERSKWMFGYPKARNGKEVRILCNGGADGIRTHDLLDAIEARSQLRHGPTRREDQVYHSR